MSMVVQIEKPAQEMSPRSCTQSFSSHIVLLWHIVMSNYCENRKGYRRILCQNNQIAHPSCTHFDSAEYVTFQVQFNDWLGKPKQNQNTWLRLVQQGGDNHFMLCSN